MVKNTPANAEDSGDSGLIPGSGKQDKIPSLLPERESQFICL